MRRGVTVRRSGGGTEEGREGRAAASVVALPAPSAAPAALRRALAGAGPLAPAEVLRLQRVVGNRAVGRLLAARSPAAVPPSAPAPSLGRVSLARTSSRAVAGGRVYTFAPAGVQRDGVLGALTSTEGLVGSVVGLGTTLVLAYSGVGLWSLAYGAAAGALSALGVGLRGGMGGAVPMELSGARLAELAAGEQGGFEVSVVGDETNPDPETQGVLEAWRTYARAHRGDGAAVADAAVMAGKLLHPVRSAERTMIVARDRSGRIQAVARLDEQRETIRVATVVANPDPATRARGAGRALLAHTARVAGDLERAIPRTVTLEAANAGLVPYYEGLGFERQ